jgi:hypothetical protein
MGPGGSLWTRKFGILDSISGFEQSMLEGIMVNVPLTVKLELQLDYGRFENVDNLPVQGFNPTYSFLFIAVWPSSADSSLDIVEQAVWHSFPFLFRRYTNV